jgi:hypothetical protein
MWVNICRNPGLTGVIRAGDAFWRAFLQHWQTDCAAKVTSSPWRKRRQSPYLTPLFLLGYFPDCTLNVQRSIHMSVTSEYGENTMQLDPMVAQGRVVAAGRMLAGVDQDKLAAEAGLSPSTISKIELGRRSVREDTLTRVLDALSRFGVDVTRNSRTGHHAVGTSFF